MRLAAFLNVAGATATSAALLLAGHYATGWPAIIAILAVSAVLATALNTVLRLRAQREHTRLRGVAVRALRASDRQQADVARALGDEAAQTLAGALLHLKAARSTASEPAGDRIGDARIAIISTMEQLERGSAVLRPSLMDLVGPEAALASLARSVCADAGLRLHADLHRLGPIPSGASRALYRITQDAIENVVAHAQASELVLETRRDGADALVVLKDDGAGFDTRAVLRRPDGALGLSTMRELAAYWGGAVRIESRIGAGTRVEIRLPLMTAFADA